MFELREHVHTLHECPNCGRRALAQVSSERYECLWCNFYRDLSQPRGIIRPGRMDGGLFLIIVFTVIVGLVLLGA